MCLQRLFHNYKTADLTGYSAEYDERLRHVMSRSQGLLMVCPELIGFDLIEASVVITPMES